MGESHISAVIAAVHSSINVDEVNKMCVCLRVSILPWNLLPLVSSPGN